MSKWISVELTDQSKFPLSPAVYVVYVNEELYYIGSSVRLDYRIRWTWMRGRRDHVTLLNAKITIKYSLSSRYGDWAMRELRLMKRLQPGSNQMHMKHARLGDKNRYRRSRFTKLKSLQ